MPQKLISIGMAVLNEERWLSQALDSVLAQDYQNIEVIICDNLSTDRTAEIAGEYVKKDSRVKYFLNKERVSSFKNYSLTFKHSSGEYFMFCGGHDLMEKNYVSSCADILDREPEVILVYSLYNYIDGSGNELRRMSYIIDTRGMGMLRRVSSLFFCLLKSNPCFGLIRSDFIKRIRFVENFRKVLNDDVIFLFQIALLGKFVQIPKLLFSYRINRPNEGSEGITSRHIKEIYGNQKYPMFFYVIHKYYVYFAVVLKMPITCYKKPLLLLWLFTLLLLIYLKVILRKILKYASKTN